MKRFFRFRTFARQSYDIFYSSNVHNLFYQLHRVQEFLELICHKVNIQKTAFQTHFGYYEFLTMSLPHAQLFLWI